MIILASVNNISRKLLLFFLLFLGITSVFAQELQDSVSIYFHQGKQISIFIFAKMDKC